MTRTSVINKHLGQFGVKTRSNVNIQNNKNWPQILAILTASFSFFNRGLHSAWTSPALPKLLTTNTTINQYFPITANEGSWIVVLYSLSICIGAPLAAYVVKKFGPKRIILFSAIPHLISLWLIAFATQIEFFYAARILSGFSEGLVDVSGSVYTGEISQPSIRGILGAIISLSIISGCLAINIIGSYTTIFQTSAICSIFPICLIGTFIWMPESPYFLIRHKNENDARKALIKLRATTDIEQELNEIKLAIEKQMKNSGSFMDIFRYKNNRKSFFILLAIITIQQCTGIMAIQSYTQVIFLESGQHFSAEISAIILMFIQLIMSTIATLFVDRLGRKPLLIFSCIGCSVSLIFEGLYFLLQQNNYPHLDLISWLPITALICYITVYSCGLAIIISVLLSELLASNIKEKALGLLIIWFGLITFIVSRFFHVMIELVGMYFPFWIYALSAIFGVFFITFCLPETKGKTLDDIQDEFMK